MGGRRAEAFANAIASVPSYVWLALLAAAAVWLLLVAVKQWRQRR
ncbi:MAG TPA: hypothetical protein VGA77_11710 [Propylenella sp.]